MNLHRDRLGRTLEPSTVNDYLASLSPVMTVEMMGWEWLDASLMTQVRNLPLPRGRIRYLSDDERTRRLEAAKASYLAELHLVVMTTLATGGRKPVDVRYAWEKVRDSVPLDDFRFHDLRHSTASYLAMSGASLVEIAEVLGHRTLQMVRCYAHLSEAHTATVMERMAREYLG